MELAKGQSFKQLCVCVCVFSLMLKRKQLLELNSHKHLLSSSAGSWNFIVLSLEVLKFGTITHFQRWKQNQNQNQQLRIHCTH